MNGRAPLVPADALDSRMCMELKDVAKVFTDIMQHPGADLLGDRPTMLRIPGSRQIADIKNRSRDDQVSRKIAGMFAGFYDPHSKGKCRVPCCACSDVIYESELTSDLLQAMYRSDHHERLAFYLSADWTRELMEMIQLEYPVLNAGQIRRLRTSLACVLCNGLICPECQLDFTLSNFGYFPEGNSVKRNPASGQMRIPVKQRWNRFMVGDYLFDETTIESQTLPISPPVQDGVDYRTKIGYNPHGNAFPACVPCLRVLRVGKCSNCVAVRHLIPKHLNRDEHYVSEKWPDCPFCPETAKRQVCPSCKTDGCGPCRLIRKRTRDTFSEKDKSFDPKIVKENLCATIAEELDLSNVVSACWDKTKEHHDKSSQPILHGAACSASGAGSELDPHVYRSAKTEALRSEYARQISALEFVEPFSKENSDRAILLLGTNGQYSANVESRF